LRGLGEQPQWYAHDAAQFAAGSDMPQHFIAYHEGQAAVLEYHMRADQRVFVDARLEVAPRGALEQYYDIALAIARRLPSWTDRLSQLPQPLGILADHSAYHSIEATLLTDAGWRCVWFDDVAGIYVPSSARPVGDRAIDFGQRYFSPMPRSE